VIYVAWFVGVWFTGLIAARLVHRNYIHPLHFLVWAAAVTGVIVKYLP
jgi:hypothetical protein